MNNDYVSFVIPGVPVAKGRARSFVRNGHIGHYTPEKTANYENLVKISASHAMNGKNILDGACGMELVLHVQIPASWSHKKRLLALEGHISPCVKPDCSNVLKAIEDAMNGVVWVDDKQLTEVNVRKMYSEVPKAIVKVRDLCDKE